LTRHAPFLRGSNWARYIEDFFTEIGGLYGKGIPFKKLKEDHGVSLESLLPIYPSNQSRNKHPVRHMSHSAAAEALRMYQRVYGGTQPDNGEFGTAFVQGLLLQAKKKVNWAEGTTELAKVRTKNLVTNLGKLTHPCLREQIQSVLNFEQGLLSRALAAHSIAVSQLKQARITICREAQLTIDKRVAVAAPTSTVAKQHGKMVSDEKGLIDVPIYVGTFVK
jgi:hypothetical protein